MSKWLGVLRGAILVLITAQLTIPAATAGQPRLPKETARWIRIETTNFSVFSDGSENMARQAAEALEMLRMVLGQLFGASTLVSPLPTKVFVFDDERSFEPYGPHLDGKTRQVGGYFSVGELSNYVAIVGPRYSTDVSSIVHHEYLHHYLRTNQPDIPLWLNEGLAGVYSTFKVEDGKAWIGYPNPLIVRWLRKFPSIPLAELVAIDHDSPDYNDSDRRFAFYVTSWGLTHMLVMGTRDGRNRASAYVQLLREGVDQDEAFSRGLGGDYQEIEKEYKRYVRRNMSYFVIPVDSHLNGTASTTKMSYAETLFHLGDLLTALGSDRHTSATEHFRASLEANELYGPSIAGLGYLEEVAGMDEAALAKYRRAAELAPDNFLANYRLGKMLCRTLEQGSDETERTSTIEEARSALQRAIAARPNFAEARAFLRYTSSLDRKP